MTSPPSSQTVAVHSVDGRPQNVPIAAFLSSALLWLSFPPIGIWPLAWLAPIPLLYLVSLADLPQKRTLCWIWLSGLTYWLATFYFVPIPHVALWAGWVVISSYLAFYTLFFFISARTLVHNWKIPLWIAAPVCWTGMEFFRCNVLTGMGLVCHSHSQYTQPLIIQCADLCGAYTLTFGMIAVAASIVSTPVLVLRFPRPTSLLPGYIGLVIFSAILAYGYFAWQKVDASQFGGTPELNESSASNERAQIEVAIIQGSIDTRLDAKAEVQEEKFRQYANLTQRALKDNPSVDLILWPENGLPTEVLDFIATTDSEESRNAELNATENLRIAWSLASGYPDTSSNPTPMILGGLTWREPAEIYNSALHLNEEGEVVGRYFKNHRVMYGEYFPILNAIPGLKESLPEIDAGAAPSMFEVNSIRLAPLICFETTVPHLVRRQLNRLQAEDQEPDAIVNLTNDGWFYGTACLDFHLACNVFRAVEMRKKNLVCANTGFSAEIRPSGVLEKVGPRRDTDILIARVTPSQLSSLYRSIGDLPVLLVALLSLAGLLHGVWLQKQTKTRTDESANSDHSPNIPSEK